MVTDKLRIEFAQVTEVMRAHKKFSCFLWGQGEEENGNIQPQVEMGSKKHRE